MNKKATQTIALCMAVLILLCPLAGCGKGAAENESPPVDIRSLSL